MAERNVAAPNRGRNGLAKPPEPAQAEQTHRYLEFIVHQLEGLDPLLEDIDERHAQYLRTSLRQIRYQLGSADGSFKDCLVSLAQQLSAMRKKG